MPEGVFGRAVRRACASVAFPHPSSYGCIVWVREACRCHALPWVVWGAVCTLRRSWRSWCRGGLRLRRAGRGQLGGDWDVERVRESPEDAADRPALTYTSCSVWLGGGRRPSGCQPPFLGRDSPSFHIPIAVWRTVSRPLRGRALFDDNSTLYQSVNFCRTQYNHLYIQHTCSSLSSDLHAKKGRACSANNSFPHLPHEDRHSEQLWVSA